jgi:hypothetical protein
MAVELVRRCAFLDSFSSTIPAMSFLKKLPISFKGELHHIQLINFSVDADEVIAAVPKEIKIRLINGRAMISLVSVKLKHMHPTFLPAWMQFNYHHLGFRLLVDDAKLNNGKCKGVFFLRSFTDKSLMVSGGKLISDYNLEAAEFLSQGKAFSMKQNNSFLSYELNESVQPVSNPMLKETIGALDRAYSVLRGRLRMIEIQREKWPIEPVHCSGFKTNFFRTAKLEGAFQVRETIFYHWLPPQFINHEMT